MAVIGPMRKLTIGNKTYQIVTGADSLPIASASTLGAIKVGTGLTIDSSTGVLNATGTSLVIDNELSGTSTNPVQNKVIKTALDNKANSNDIPTKVSDLTNDSGFTSNTGTVTSVRVQATSPVQSSTSTAQNSSLNTTISLADGYGDTKNPYGTKTANYVLAGPSSGNAAAPSFRELVASDIPDLSETYLTSFTETDPVFSASVAHGITSSDISNWNGKTSLTIGTSSTTAAAGNHKHGNITNGGDITTTATIANGDRLIINDESASKVTNSSITFGTNASKYLSNAGTWGDIPTTLPASDVSDWAKADTKPSYNFSELTTKPTTINGYGITDAYSKTEIDGLIAGVLHYKGTKATVSALPSSNNTLGDVWHITADGSEYAWDGSTWQELGTAVDLSGYMASTNYPDLVAIEGISATSGLLKKTAANTWTLDTNSYLTSYTETDPTVPSWAKESTKPSYTASQVGAATDDHVHGNITNGGDITATAPIIASGDKLIINDQSASKITNGLSFGTSTTQYLANNGTWQNVPDISGKIDTAGTGLSKSGTTLNHSNSVTAQTTQAVYPIKIDAQGHISDYGSAVTISDTKVTQSAAITTAGQYPVILGYNTGTAAVTNTVNKSANLTYNPNTNELTNAGGITCGSLDDNYGLNDSALLYQTTMDKWKLILGIEDQEE